MNIHPTTPAVAGKITVSEHEHSDGPYAVVGLSIGGFDLTIFPKGETVAALGAILSEMGAELLRLAPTVGAKVKALAD